jgi:hypothetical protein
MNQPLDPSAQITQVLEDLATLSHQILDTFPKSSMDVESFAGAKRRHVLYT